MTLRTELSWSRWLSIAALGTAALELGCGEMVVPRDVPVVRDTVAADASGDTPIAPMDAPPEAGCAMGETTCGGRCSNLQTDNANCGSCRTLCPAGVGCIAGSCSCRTPSLACSGVCINPQMDAMNCGMCGNACAMGQTCAFGMCVADCPMPGRLCNAMGTVTCASVQTDPMNCGGCGVRCSPGYQCAGGRCGCSAPRMMCGAACADLQTDGMHCGMCDNGCGTTGTCVAGVCMCNTGGTRCGTTCADTMTDTSNCGSCGNVCAMGQSCVAGRCVCAGGRTGCGAICVDTMTDMAHCGSCTTVCPATSTCVGGMCQCPTGQTFCGTICTNLMTDTSNCGACGNSCGPGGACAAGRCTCAAGYTMCGAACTDTAFDRNNCASCGRVCPTGQLCVMSACTSAPPLHYTFTRGTLPFVDACAAPGAVRMLMSMDDVIGPAVTIPYMFPFFGRPYTTIRPSTNGYVLFGSTAGPMDNAYYPTMPLPDASRPRPAAFAFNSDLWQRAAGGVCVATIGTAPSRRTVIESLDAGMCCGDAGVAHFTFEIILNESDGTLDYVYQTINHGGPGGAYFVIGAQNETALSGSTYEFRMGPPMMITAPMSLHLVPAP